MVAAGVLGATCATEPRHVDSSPSPTAAATPAGEDAEGYRPPWFPEGDLDQWTADELAREEGRYGICTTVYANHHCHGPLSGETPWTVEDLLFMVRISERLAVLEPSRARHWYESAVNWRIWARDVEARRRWPPHACHGYDAEGGTGHFDCVGPDWQPSGQAPWTAADYDRMAARFEERAAEATHDYYRSLYEDIADLSRERAARRRAGKNAESTRPAHL